jgi:hypothetical protein
MLMVVMFAPDPDGDRLTTGQDPRPSSEAV